MKSVKRILANGLAVVMFVALAGCGNAAGSQNASTAETQENNAAEQETTQEEETEAPEMQDTAGSDQAGNAENGDTAGDTDNSGTTGSNVLVVYFSRTGEQYTVGVIDKGNTAIVAEMIADGTGADMFEVLPQEDNYPYTYDELIDVAKEEQNANARPAYQGNTPDLSQYDTIFIGAPVWWGDWPMIMYTFFENEDLSGKTLIPFSTHEGSGLAGFDRKLAGACPASVVLDGLAIRGNDAQNQQESVRSSVNDWLSGLKGDVKNEQDH